MKISGPLLGFMLMCLMLSTVEGKRVNCRKYIYAPICRGVAAKRDIPRSIQSLGNEKRKSQPYYGEFGIITLLTRPSKQWEFDRRDQLGFIKKKIDVENPEYDNGNGPYIAQ